MLGPEVIKPKQINKTPDVAQVNRSRTWVSSLLSRYFFSDVTSEWNTRNRAPTTVLIFIRENVTITDRLSEAYNPRIRHRLHSVI